MTEDQARRSQIRVNAKTRVTQAGRVAVVMACFNRKATTLKCLDSLFAQATGHIELNIYLLDDDSSDGTAHSVREFYPSVHVIEGNGQLYWCGGMRAAMAEALQDEFDFILWLNDDVELRPDALEILLSSHCEAENLQGSGPHLIVGAVSDPTTGDITYSGLCRRNSWHPAQLERVPPNPSQLTPCHTMNGNCVLIPAAVVKAIGLVDPAFVQQIGDIDYGFRARRAGAKLWIAPLVIGTCSPNDRIPKWREPGIGLRERARRINHPLGHPLRPWLTYMWRYGGLIGVALLGATYFRALARK